MANYTTKAYLSVTPGTDILDLTFDVKKAIRDSKIQEGMAVVISPSGTTAICLLENDPELHKAAAQLMEDLIIETKDKAPKVRSGTGPNHCHMRASLLSRSVIVPISLGDLLVDPWQQILAIDFDKKQGRKEIIIQIYGDGAKEE